MKHISEKTYRFVFLIGIAIKGVISVGEIALGVLFYSFDYTTLMKWMFYLTGDELTETNRDVFWKYTLHAMSGFSATPQSVWAFIFVSHGIVKTFLAIGLLKNVRWIYPASAIVFTLFVIYQCYQLTYAPSFLLAAITVFDIILIWLITREYRRVSPAAK
jgi:uncharacterized membrane protein